MTGGARFVGAENGTDFKHFFKAGRNAHLFIELRRLREIRFAVEIFQLEQFGARFAGIAHQLGRMNFGKTVRQPELAHCHFRHRLRAENELMFVRAQIQKTPIQTFIAVGFVIVGHINRQEIVGNIHRFHRLRPDFHAVEFYEIVYVHFARNFHRRFHGERRHRFVDFGVLFVFLYGYLHRFAHVAHYQKLHGFFVAHLLDEPADFHHFAVVLFHVFNHCSHFLLPLG